jgi:hypothetical protein
MIALSTWVGCSYSFEVASCTVRCADNRCPQGLACLDDGYCHAATTEPMCPCVPLRCEDVAGSCGDMPDTCGAMVPCGGCSEPLTCGGGGTPNVCGDPTTCVPQPCPDGACGPVIDSCGNASTCPGCPQGEKCASGQCVPCTPQCVEGELACGDDGCGGSCGTCPDERWDCHTSGICCIRNNERCTPLTEGCNCCPGLFCISGFCTPASGCAMAPNTSTMSDEDLAQ